MRTVKTLFVASMLPFASIHAQQGGTAVCNPVELTQEQDHQRLMDMLGMKTIRPGANGSNPNAPNAANYDEAKSNPYPTLPQLLRANDRREVTTPDLWWSVRRPELVELFDREIYGRQPADVPAVRWEVTETKRDSNAGIPIITKTLIGHVDNSRCPAITVDIQAVLSTPANAKGPVPVMIQFSGFGFGFPMPGRAGGPPAAGRGGAPAGAGRGGPPAGRGGPPPGPTWQQQVLSRGWGFALINTGSVQADNAPGLTRGIIGLTNKGQPRKLDDWGVLRAWAWGASRLLDYFETDKAVDAKRVGVEGHSRWGKATLVAMAYDQRFAIAYVSSSGEGGAKLLRRWNGEQVENIAGFGAYHWVAGNFLKYAGPLTWDDLPVDMHEFIALCAPRPVFISAGDVGDSWVDARGMFMAAAASQPAYELLGKKGMGTNDFPSRETNLAAGDIAFRQHSGGHTDGPNWPFFLEFADRYFKPQP